MLPQKGLEVEDWLALYEHPKIIKMSFKGPSTFYYHQSKRTLIPVFYQAVYGKCIQLCEHRNKESRSNLVKEELNALETLWKVDDIIIRQADKGGGLVLLDRGYYVEEAYRILSDASTYQELHLGSPSFLQKVVDIIDS